MAVTAKGPKGEASLQVPPVNSLIVAFVRSIIRGVASVLRLQDGDRKDADDIAADILEHVGDVLSALLSPNPNIPAFPHIPFESPSDLSPEAKREAKKQFLMSIYSDTRRGSTRLWVELARATLQEIGAMFVMLDADSTGADDRIGYTLIYGADILNAVLGGQELPTLPTVLEPYVVKEVKK